MTDYSNVEAYLLNGEIMYRTARYYTPYGNDSKRYPQTYGAGRPKINYYLSDAGSAVGNPYVDKTCYAQPPIVYMESVPYDRRTGKFSDVFFYTDHRFAPGNN
jgi:hypothetical protein